MRLPNETEELIFVVGAVAVAGYVIWQALKKLGAAFVGAPMVLADNIEIPGTGQTAGALRALGYTNDQINTMWGEQVAAGNPQLDPGQYGIFIAP